MADLAVDCSEWLKSRGRSAVMSTSTFRHGQPYTVTGSGFGSKATAAPTKYDNFQNLALGQDVAANGWTVEGYHHPVADNRRLRSGTPYTRNMSCFFEHDIAFGDGGDKTNAHLAGLTTTRYYLDFWHYIETLADPQPQNIKPFRFHQVNSGAPNLHYGFGGPSDSNTVLGRDGNPEEFGIWFSTTTDNSAPNPRAFPGSSWYDEWNHFQVLLDVGTPGQLNGTIACYLNGELRMAYWGNLLTLATGYTNYPELHIGNYIRSDPHGDTYATWESVYIDSSWARVEIGDNATYASCTHREIQIPTVWASNGTSVTFTVNRGSFAVNDTVNIFVIDSSNTVQNVGTATIGAD